MHGHSPIVLVQILVIIKYVLCMAVQQNSQACALVLGYVRGNIKMDVTTLIHMLIIFSVMIKTLAGHVTMAVPP